MTEQLSFVPPAKPRPRIPYKGRAPRVKGSETSEAAADSIEPVRGTLQHTVWSYIRMMRGFGSTDEQGATKLGIPLNTYRPRRRELEEMGLIHKSEMRRPTESGRTAAVYVAA